MSDETEAGFSEAPSITYRLETFEGPLDLLLSLVHKNKMDIRDIQISVICEQYFEYLAAAEDSNIELTVDFLVLASDLMLIKSKMLLPTEEDSDEEDPRAGIADALARLEAAKRAAKLLGERYAVYRGRTEKEPEDISPDRSFVAEGQSTDVLYNKIRILISEFRSYDEKLADRLVKPLVARPVVSLELKIFGIMKHFEKDRSAGATLGELLDDAENRPELVTIFIGVLELIKMKRLLIVEDPDDFSTLKGLNTRFEVNPDYTGDLTAGISADEYGKTEPGNA